LSILCAERRAEMTRLVNGTTLLLGISMLLFSATAHGTAEICGNGIDDNGNGLTDEGCYPTITTGVCESPLSCGDTGMVSWTTGSLHYDLPPDEAPNVPYGPGIGFRRFYTPMYAPNGGNIPASINPTPLGPGWQHTYMTWVTTGSGSGSDSTLIWHTSQGRDVNFQYSSTVGSAEYFTPQPGDHVLTMEANTTNGYYYIRLLTGEMLVYNQYGQLYQIWDTLPTPNIVTVTWTSTTAGNVSTVTDASGLYELSFSYTNNLLTELDYLTGPDFHIVHSVKYTYDNHVTRDATSGWYVPASSTEWSELLAGTDISAPTDLWECQETSGSLSDSIGTTSLALTNNGGASYSQTVAGWSRKALSLTLGSTSNWSGNICNPATSSCTALGLVDITSMPDDTGAYSAVLLLGGDPGVVPIVYDYRTYPHPYSHEFATAWNDAVVDGGLVPGTDVWLASSNSSTETVFGQAGTNQLSPSWTTPSSSSQFLLGGYSSGWGANGMNIFYATAWNGTALTETQAIDVRNLLANGPGILTTVTIGSDLVQSNNYYSDGYLSSIDDGSGTQIVAFSYSSSGAVNQIMTAKGNLGFDYDSSRASCGSDTILYFNQGSNTLSCGSDSDCGTGYLCGGKTGTGATGICFQAARCMTTSTANGSNSESVVTNITALAGSGTCTGACLDVEQYNWSSASNLLNVIGREDPLGNYTSASYNSSGLPTVVGYGDQGDNPAAGSANRYVYYFYDSTYPGRIAEIRRASDISGSASSCGSGSTAGCERTIYSYGSDYQLDSIQQTGYTLGSNGSPTTFSNTITYTHDSNGRITEIQGGVSGIETTFSFYSTSSAPGGGFLETATMYTGGSNTLTSQITEYDVWNHPTSLKDPSGNFTCDTYDSNLAYLTQRRRAMDGQSSCVTSGSDDITTNWFRDTALRLTSLQRPDGGCVMYTYRSNGTLSQVTRSDTCESNYGDYQLYTYYDGLLEEVDTHSGPYVGGSQTGSQSYKYYQGRQLQHVVNPASPSYSKNLDYDSAGKLTEVDGEDSLSQTNYSYSGSAGRDGRVTSEQDYDGSAGSDTWSLLYSWMDEQTSVTDGESKTTKSLRDDAGNLVELSTPDQANPTIFVYDAANRLVTKVEDLGGADQETHTFTYDGLSRPLVDNYYGECTAGSGGSAHPWIQRTYDALPSGVSCPITGGCNNLAGHLAYVDTVLMCDSGSGSAYLDGSLDQFTYYSYDAVGRVAVEYITDDTARTAQLAYTYNADGAISTVLAPSGVELLWNYGAGGWSGVDLVSSIQYNIEDNENVIDTVAYYPFGPVESYNQENTISGSKIKTAITRNLAYRISDIQQNNGSTVILDTAITEDAKGRVTSRVYSDAGSGVESSYFQYDEEDRVTCETTDSVSSCPTSGSDLKNNHSLSPPFTSAGEWKRVLRPINGSTGFTNDFNSSGSGYGSSHQVTSVDQLDGTPAFGVTAFTYDERGNRESDDNSSMGGSNGRTYTYDARRNVVNVRGQYYVDGNWDYYDVASAFDAGNRRVYKSFYDETSEQTSTWFFYYDPINRLTEIRYTPNTATSGTYDTYQLVWLGNRLVAYLEEDTIGLTTTNSARYVGTDESGRAIDMWSWPGFASGSGSASRVWSINPSAWGMDEVVVGVGTFQPVLFAGQYQDVETTAYENDGVTVHRPGVVLEGQRTYDPFTGGYLQVDPMLTNTWSTYVYAHSDPIGVSEDGTSDATCGCSPADGSSACYLAPPCWPTTSQRCCTAANTYCGPTGACLQLPPGTVASCGPGGTGPCTPVPSCGPGGGGPCNPVPACVCDETCSCPPPTPDYCIQPTQPPINAPGGTWGQCLDACDSAKRKCDSWCVCSIEVWLFYQRNLCLGDCTRWYAACNAACALKFGPIRGPWGENL
jgi:YD repeat-containing protein